MKTRKTNPNKPPRICIFGESGVGKSSFGARAEKPIFICPEGGADQLAVDEMEGMNSWDGIRNGIVQLINEKHDFKTLVIDSADWVEKICHAKIIGNSGRSIITAGTGYGHGYRESEKLHRELIEDLSILRDKKDMNIVITAHCVVKQVKDPAILEDYDQFSIKCHDMVSSLWKEWSDAVFFVRFRTFSKSSDDSVRARALGDGTRVLYAIKQPAFDAKNRYGMPGEFEFTENFWPELLKYTKQEVSDDVIKQINVLASKITDDITKKKIFDSLSAAQGQIQKLKPIRDRLLELTKEN